MLKKRVLILVLMAAMLVPASSEAVTWTKIKRAVEESPSGEMQSDNTAIRWDEDSMVVTGGVIEDKIEIDQWSTNMAVDRNYVFSNIIIEGGMKIVGRNENRISVLFGKDAIIRCADEAYAFLHGIDVFAYEDSKVIFTNNGTIVNDIRLSTRDNGQIVFDNAGAITGCESNALLLYGDEIEQITVTNSGILRYCPENDDADSWKKPVLAYTIRKGEYTPEEVLKGKMAWEMKDFEEARKMYGLYGIPDDQISIYPAKKEKE